MNQEFFKIVVDPSKRYLPLPVAYFNTNYANSIPPDSVTLLRSDGLSWEVGLRLINDQYSISRGWQPFVRDNAIDIADCIIFEVRDITKWHFTIVSVDGQCRTDPVFYHTLLSTETPYMRIPSKFIADHLHDKNPISWFTIVGCLNRSWRIKVERCSDDVFGFTECWSDLVRDLGFHYATFIVFRLINQTTFKITPFKPNGLPKVYVKQEVD